MKILSIANKCNIKIFILLGVLILSGCSVTPYKELNLDTTSNFKTPTEGKTGVYVYQWKTGPLGALVDVDFDIKGKPEVSLNTGEYAHFEIDPGQYEYKLLGGLFPMYAPVEFESNENYFFRAFLLNFSDNAYLVRDQIEINEAKKHILSGRYEINTKD